MEVIYGILEMILPFEFTEYTFMKNALIAIILVSPIFAILGTMIVNNKMAFFSDALGHSALTGIGIGMVLGLKQPLLCMIAFGILLSIAITKVKGADMLSSDSIISVFSSAAMALGIVILSQQGGFAKYSYYLIGDILTITQNDLMLIIMTLIVCYVVWILLYNDLLLVSINRSFAVSRGVNVVFTENAFVILVAVTVMISIKWIGILTINSLLILPAAAARNISVNVKQYHCITTVIGCISAIIGLVVSYEWGTSAGAAIVLVAAVIFFVTLFFRKK